MRVPERTAPRQTYAPRTQRLDRDPRFARAGLILLGAAVVSGVIGELVEEAVAQPERVREDVCHRARYPPGFGEVSLDAEPEVRDIRPDVFGIVAARVERELRKVGCR